MNPLNPWQASTPDVVARVELPFASWLARQRDRQDSVGYLARVWPAVPELPDDYHRWQEALAQRLAPSMTDGERRFPHGALYRAWWEWRQSLQVRRPR